MMEGKTEKNEKPSIIIVSDMTAFHTRYGRYYEVTFYFDVFTKQILSWSLAERRGDRRQYIDGLEQVIAILEASGCIDPVILHTDQGSVYASQAYNELIENTVITRSMSRAGKPTDNPVNESLNGWIKEELMTDFHLAESHDLKQTITRYVDFYNTERPAYSLGYMTPKMFYKAFMDGKIEHRDTFSNRELSEIPKFVRKKMKEKAELNSIKLKKLLSEKHCLCKLLKMQDENKYFFCLLLLTSTLLLLTSTRIQVVLCGMMVFLL